jgi:hypothetical protein
MVETRRFQAMWVQAIPSYWILQLVQPPTVRCSASAEARHLSRTGPVLLPSPSFCALSTAAARLVAPSLAFSRTDAQFLCRQ